MNYTIRKLLPYERDILDTFLYEAIFIPEGVEAPPREIIYRPELQVYVEDFGTRAGDTGFVAEADGSIVGAAWARIMDDYGHLDDRTPSCAVSLLGPYRAHGMGTALMSALLADLGRQGFERASLAVQKKNYAVRMYKKLGFVTVGENDEEFIMSCVL